MKRKIIFKIVVGIIVFVLLLLVLTKLVAEPWIEREIRAALNENNSKYQVEIQDVRVSVFRPGLELKTIGIRTRQDHIRKGDLNGEIRSIKLKGINLFKTLFKKDITIREIVISGVNGVVPFPEDSIQQLISSFGFQVGKIHVEKINIAIKKSSSEEMYSVKEGVFNIYHLQVFKSDTLSPGILKKFDFEARELLSVSPDSMYTIAAHGIIYFSDSAILQADSFSVHPNYKEYDFVERKKFQTDRIDASTGKIHVHDFSVSAYLKSRALESSYVEIEKMNVNVFRDKRKELKHVNKSAFQDMIYNYPGRMDIDSVGVINGKAIYTEHAEKANHPGRISFARINAKIYRVTNDTIFKKEEAYLELKGDALLMGKGKANVLLKARLFDKYNTFLLNGTLSAMNAEELNPMLERNAFVYATSGKIDKMNFSFTANNTKATGKMNLLYHDLHLAVKNERTDDTTALNEKIVSIIANIKVMDSNPLPGEEVRVGIIDFERNPEKFLFYYCAKAILSGIKSSVVKNPKRKKRSRG